MVKLRWVEIKMSDKAKIARSSQVRSPQLGDQGLERSAVLSGGIQETMIDLLEGYLPEWVRMPMLRLLLYAWFFEWFLSSIGLIFFSTAFLTVCVVIMGGNLRSATPATHSLITAVHCIWFLISRLHHHSTSPVQWTAVALCGTLKTSGVGNMLLFEMDGGGDRHLLQAILTW